MTEHGFARRHRELSGMRTETEHTIFLKDYAPTPYRIDKVELDVHIAPDVSRVRALLTITPRGRKRKCRVRWRYGEAMGVEFTDRDVVAEEPASRDAVPEPAE